MVEIAEPARYLFLVGILIIGHELGVEAGAVVLIGGAIAAAGGYTDFANPKKVEIKRGDELLKLNAKTIQRNPDKDIFVKTGDVIVVRRSYW